MRTKPRAPSTCQARRACTRGRSERAGLGYYAAALSVYDNFIQRGRDVVFPKDTRIEIETAATGANPQAARSITPPSMNVLFCD